MDYAATYLDAYIQYYASDMKLNIDSDASYLVLPNARSRIVGYYFFKINNNILNVSIHVECKTLKHVISSAAECETGGIFINGQNTIPLGAILISINHSQPPIPIKTDNTTSFGYAHNNVQLNKSKSWDMRRHWLRDNKTHEYIRVFWESGDTNDADYFSKHHPTKYHQLMRPKYVQDKVVQLFNMMKSTLRGCIIPRVVRAR